MVAFIFSHPKGGKQANAFRHDEKKQAFTGNWQLNTGLTNMHQPDKALAPPLKQTVPHVSGSEVLMKAPPNCCRSLQELISRLI